jgi:transcriptional regulator with XRE-family HTH domain
MEQLTKQQVQKLIRDRVEELGSQLAVAEAAGVSAAYISDILNDKREPGPTVLTWLGLEAQTVYTEAEATG